MADAKPDDPALLRSRLVTARLRQRLWNKIEAGEDVPIPSVLFDSFHRALGARDFRKALRAIRTLRALGEATAKTIMVWVAEFQDVEDGLYQASQRASQRK